MPMSQEDLEEELEMEYPRENKDFCLEGAF
jgi:hypothetical protein